MRCDMDIRNKGEEKEKLNDKKCTNALYSAFAWTPALILWSERSVCAAIDGMQRFMRLMRRLGSTRGNNIFYMSQQSSNVQRRRIFRTTGSCLSRPMQHHSDIFGIDTMVLNLGCQGAHDCKQTSTTQAPNVSRLVSWIVRQ